MVLVDHYEVLDLPKFASSEEVKRSYRKLALKYHPDKNKTAGAEDRFKQINDSYKVLTDSLQKSNYDLKLRATTARSMAGTTTTTTTTTTSTTTTRASFNPKSKGFQSPSTLQANSYKTRNFDHLFSKSNAKQDSPKSKFHYSNFDRSHNIPPSASRPKPIYRSNPYATTNNSTFNTALASKDAKKGEVDSENNGPEASITPAMKAEKASIDEKMKRKLRPRVSGDARDFHGLGKEEDPIVLDENEEDKDRPQADKVEAKFTYKDDVTSDSDYLPNEDDDETSSDSKTSNPILNLNNITSHFGNNNLKQRFGKLPFPLDQNVPKLSLNRNSASKASPGKRRKYNVTPNANSHTTNLNGVSNENRVPVEIVDDLDLDEEMNSDEDIGRPASKRQKSEYVKKPSEVRALFSKGASMTDFEEVKKVPPFTQNYGDLNLDDVSESISGMAAMNQSFKSNPKERVRKPSIYPAYDSNKRFKRDIPESERQAHEPVNNLERRYAHQPRKQAVFVNDHPIFKCRLPMDYDPSKQIHRLNLEDLYKAPFDLHPPKAPQMNFDIQTIGDYKQLLNQFYAYEEQFKVYETTFIFYFKYRAESDILQMKNVFGYNSGTENFHSNPTGLMDLQNLLLFVNITKTDLNITRGYNQTVEEHNILLEKFYEACNRMAENFDNWE